MEIYPCKSTKNKVIRLPFQKGYRLLDEELLPYWCGSNVLDRADLFLKLPKTDAKEANFKPPIPRKGQVKLLTANQQKLEDGRYYYENGLDSKSSRSMALFAISYYLFVGCGYGYDKKEERAQLMLKWMRQKHNGFSHEWNRNPRAVEKHICRLASWKPSDHKPTKPRSQYEIYNKKKSIEIQARIVSGVASLFESGKLFKRNGTINRAAVERESKIDGETAKKHISLIKQEYLRLKAE